MSAIALLSSLPLYPAFCLAYARHRHRATARVAKTSIEQAQRDLRKAKEVVGEKHVSSCFAVGQAGEWVATHDTGSKWTNLLEVIFPPLTYGFPAGPTHEKDD